MTKEELEKEADKWLVNNLHSTEEDYKRAFLAGAEPREKQIEIDAEQIRALQKQNGELTDKVRELENKLENIRHYLDNEIPHELINEATTIIYKMV